MATLDQLKENYRKRIEDNFLDRGDLETKNTELDSPKRRRSQVILRYYFLDAIAKHIPVFLEEFEREFLGCFCKEEEFRRKLRHWFKDRHLDADWVVEAAYKTLEMWANPKSIFGRQVSILQHKAWYKDTIFGVIITPLIEPPPGMPIYTPTQTTQKRYLNDIKETLESQFTSPLFIPVQSHIKPVIKLLLQNAKDYCKKVEAAEREDKGLLKPISKKNIARDIEWAVLYQIKNMRPTDIAQYHKLKKGDHRTVDNAVKRILREIELPPPRS